MNEWSPLISVIVPVYNGREVLGPCLAAIRAQEGIARKEVELIVVDDGSSDGGADAAAGLADRVIRLEENRGAAAARNRGAREARADVVVFVDADVFLEKDALAAISKLFQERPDISAAVGRYAELPARPGLVNLYHNLFTNYHHDLSPEEIDWFWGAIGAVRKEALFAVGGFDERYQGASAEDMELGLALAAAGHKILFRPEIQGAHGHEFTLKKMLVNDYKKAVLGTKLRLRGRLPRRAPRFARPGNVMPPILVMAAPFFYLFAIFGPAILGIFSLMMSFISVYMIFALNLDFYKHLGDRLQNEFHRGMFIHWLQAAIMLLGAAAGTIGYLLRRSPYGRPGWI